MKAFTALLVLVSLIAPALAIDRNGACDPTLTDPTPEQTCSGYTCPEPAGPICEKVGKFCTCGTS